MFPTNNLAVTTFQGFMKAGTETKETQGFVRHPTPPLHEQKLLRVQWERFLNDNLGVDFYVILGHL